MKCFRYEKGMTLIEIILALAILGIVLIAVLNLFSSGITWIYTAGQRTITTEEVQEIMDAIYTENNIQQFENKTDLEQYLTNNGYNVVDNINKIATLKTGYEVNCYVEDSEVDPDGASANLADEIEGYEVTVLKFFQNNTSSAKVAVFLIKGGD